MTACPERLPTAKFRISRTSGRTRFGGSGAPHRIGHRSLDDERPVLTGAGSSAYAATAIAAAWPGRPSDPDDRSRCSMRGREGCRRFRRTGLLISIARSGDSPESVGVVELIQRVRPDVRHLALMCNEQGRLAKTKGVSAILLDPRTNDRSLAVTSAYSNLVLAGLALRHADRLQESVAAVSARTRAALAALDASAKAGRGVADLARHGAHAAGAVRRGARSVAQSARND